jgi:small GTP-binding protein
MKQHVKVVLAGDTGVGKTAIYHALQGGRFSGEHTPTIGGDYHNVDLGDGFEAGLWDTAGQEAYRIIIPMYFRDSSVILVVFDVTSRSSFEHIEEWVSTAQATAPENAKLFVLGNKSDRLDARKVELGEGEEMAQTVKAYVYLETSAMTGEGLDLLKMKLRDVAEAEVGTKGSAPEAGVLNVSMVQLDDDEENNKAPLCC